MLKKQNLRGSASFLILMNQIEQNPSLDKPISPTIFIFVKLMQQYATYNGKM